MFYSIIIGSGVSSSDYKVTVYKYVGEQIILFFECFYLISK